MQEDLKIKKRKENTELILDYIKKYDKFITKMAFSICRKCPKLEIEDSLKEEVRNLCEERLDEAIRIKDKITKYETIDSIEEEIVEKYTKEFEESMKADEFKELIECGLRGLLGVESELFPVNPFEFKLA